MKIFRTWFFFSIIFWGVWGKCLMGSDHYSLDTSTKSRAGYFILLRPSDNTAVTKGPLTFMWQYKSDPDFQVVRYDVMFWSKRIGFKKTYTVSPDDSSEIVSLKFNECRKVFRRHGRYFWRIKAFDVEGNQKISELKSFLVKIPKEYGRFRLSTYPYEIQFQYTHRLRLPEYREFLEDVSPSTPLRSFSDLSLVFRQDSLWNRSLQLSEKFFILSQIGLGWEVLSRIQIERNLYFSLCPWISGKVCWFSTGLRNYSSVLYYFRIGSDLVVMPSGYLTLRGSWIPFYRVRYAEKGGGPRTFEGVGWEFGVRLIIPNDVLNIFRLFGLEFDFQRIPLEFNFCRIRDQYSGTLMRIRRFGVGCFIR